MAAAADVLQLPLLLDERGRVVARAVPELGAAAPGEGWTRGLAEGVSLVDALRSHMLAGDAEAAALFTGLQAVLDARLPRFEHAGTRCRAQLVALTPGTPAAVCMILQLVHVPGDDTGAAAKPDVPEPWPQVARRSPRHLRLAGSLREQHAGKQVLLADDDLIAREALLEMLTDVGLQVDVADDGQAAVEQVARRAYDLVLLDLRMPRLDGLDAARTIRGLPGRSGTPLVAVTANTFDEDRKACKDAGMDDFLPKPVAVEALYETLLRWLGPPSPLPPTSPLLPPPPQPAGAGASTALRAELGPLLGLEGIDAQAGLAMVGGRLELYRRLLRVFVQSHAGDALRVGQALQGHDRDQAAAITHRLRGSAATLGLVEVEAAAARVEQACDDGTLASVPDATLQQLAQALDGTVGQLRAALD